MVLVLAACPPRFRWLRTVRRLELLELPVQPPHIQSGKDGNCGQCIPGLDLVSASKCESSVQALLSALLTSSYLGSSTSYYSSLLVSRPTSGGKRVSALQLGDAISSYNTTAVLQSIWSNSRQPTLRHQLPARRRILSKILYITQVQVRMRTPSRMLSVAR